MADHRPTVLVFGTYDLGGGRLRSVLGAMRHRGWRIEACHARLWEGSAAKVAVFRGTRLLHLMARAAVLYPLLVARALGRLPVDFMLIPTGGFLDILFGWPAARLAGARVIFDPLYGVHETVVEDRRLVPPQSLTARATRWADRLCFRLADVVLIDTEEHAEYLARTVGLARRRMIVVPVGAEDDLFLAPADAPPRNAPAGLDVLFYGTMIPLHGADAIVRAACLITDPEVRFTLVGRGQMSGEIEALARDLKSANIRFVPDVPYEALPRLIRDADVCLGIFGTTAKAQYIVPTKLYQCMAMGRPVVTGDTPATRRLFRPGEHLLTVPCGNAAALAGAILRLKNDPALRRRLGAAARAWYTERFAAGALAAPLAPLEAYA